MKERSMKPLTFCYDATSLGRRVTGLERYTEELLKSFAPRLVADGGHLTVLFPSQEVKERLSPLLPTLGISALIPPPSLSPRLLRDHVWVPGEMVRVNPDVAFFPAFPPSPRALLPGGKTRLWRVIHDAVSWNFSRTISWKNRFYFLPLEKIAINRYNLIITVSEFSRQELVSVFPEKASRIVSCGNAVASASSRISPEEGLKLRKKWDLPERYLLFVGTLEPRKNIPFLIELMGDLRRRCPGVGLVIAGREGWGRTAVHEALKKAGPNAGVILTGSVSEEELQALYSGASVTVFPSLYEGFGYPVLEAMQWDCPVVASKIPVMEEVVRKGGLLVPVSDRLGWIEAVAGLLENAEERRRMVAAGRENLERFRWEGVADRLLGQLALSRTSGTLAPLS